MYYVYEPQEVGPPMRIPMQFASRGEAQGWIDRRQRAESFISIQYEIRSDNPEADAEQAQRFTDA